MGPLSGSGADVATGDLLHLLAVSLSSHLQNDNMCSPSRSQGCDGHESVHSSSPAASMQWEYTV